MARVLRYREFRPPPPLGSIVECLWEGTVSSDGPAHAQRVLPDGCMDLIWSGSELLVAGPDTAAFLATTPPGAAAVGLRFRPGAGARVLGVPATALRDSRVSLAELCPGAARSATSRLEAGRSPADTLVDVARRLWNGTPDPMTTVLVAQLGAGTAVATVADGLGCTTRTVHRRCEQAVGYGPGMLRRVLRFRRAADLLYLGVPIAEVAARAGYADQPHLSREVSALAGVAPSQLASGANRSTPLPSGSRTVA